MITGRRTPRRVECYLRYKTSNIFETSPNREQDPSYSSIQTSSITPKVNQKKFNSSFQPQYENITAYQRYLDQYWNERDQLQNKDFKTNIISNSNTFYDNVLLNNRNNEDKIIYSARNRYLHEFFGEEAKNLETREKMKRSKSVFQKRSLLNESENYKDEKSDNDFQNLSKKVFVNALKSNIFNSSSFIKSNPLPSDILEEEMKFSFYEKYPKKNNDYKTIKATKKANLPSQFDWKYHNTELSTKEHINKSRNVQKNLINSYRKPPHLEDIISTKEISQTYFKIPKKKPDNDINTKEYEVIGTKNSFYSIEPKMIKKMLISNGFHICNYNDSLDNQEWVNDQRITFKIRKDEKDLKYYNKINETKKELESYGVKLQEIDNSLKKFNKKRDSTPGTALFRDLKKIQLKE